MNRVKNARRMFAALLASLLLLCACAEKPDAEAYDTLSALQADLAAQTRASLGFRMEASFRDPDTGKSGVLYYLDGETRYDMSAGIAWQRFTMTRLGATVNAEEFYENGVRTHVENGQETLIQTEPDALFGSFPYRRTPLPAFADLKSLQTEKNSSGMLYTLTSSTGQKQLIEEIWGLDLYALAGIAVPDPEKESYGNVIYTWSVSGEDIRTIFVKLTVSLYEKAGYTPGYTAKDDAGRLELTIQAQVSFREAGSAVEIPAYGAV